MRKIWLIDKVGSAGINTSRWAIPLNIEFFKYNGYIKSQTDVVIWLLCFYIRIEGKAKYNKDCEVIE